MLDLLRVTSVTRDNDCVLIDTYRKSTFTGLLTNWKSNTHLAYKLSLIRTLLFRSYCICSNWLLIHKNFQYIKNTLSKNGFPEFIIDKCINKFLFKCFNKIDNSNFDVPKLNVLIKLPYYGKESLKLRNSLNNLISSFIFL